MMLSRGTHVARVRITLALLSIFGLAGATIADQAPAGSTGQIRDVAAKPATVLGFEERFTVGGADGIPAGWRLLTFPRVRRATVYRLVREEGRGMLRAESDRGAALLVHPLVMDPRRVAQLSWRWRVDQPLRPTDPRTKATDDYAARVYVGFRTPDQARSVQQRVRGAVFRRLHGFDPPTHSISYVWASGSLRGEHYRSPYDDRTGMIVLRDARDGVGVWQHESRDIARDYREIFGTSPPSSRASIVTSVAIMTDADNTQAAAIASYADLVLGPATASADPGR
jgi:hypothetical protein